MAKGKAWKDKTVKELKSEIRELTKQVNTRVASIKLTRELPKDVEQAVNYMKRLSGVETETLPFLALESINSLIEKPVCCLNNSAV